MEPKIVAEYFTSQPGYKYANDFDINNINNQTLYHFTNIYALQNILLSKTLWLTKSDYLNDETELEYAKSLMLNMLDRRNQSRRLRNRVWDFLYSEEITDRSFVLSFSKFSDSLTLWSGYSKMEGYNIGINTLKFYEATKSVIEETLKKHLETADINLERDYNIIIKDVVYDRETQINMIKEIFRSAEYVYKQYKDNLISSYYVDKFLDQIVWSLANLLLLFKNSCFRDEKESRMIITFKKDIYMNTFLKHRILNGSFIPYIELSYLDENKNISLPIKSIKIGPKNNSDLSKTGLESFLKTNGFNEIEVSNSIIPLRY